jgi:hypothetical protein
MTIYYRVNISRPSIYVEDQNKRLCEYIEPLRKAEKVKVSACYSYNLEQYKQGKSCIHGPGRKYYFWFTEKKTAQKFINDWMKELGVSPYFEDYVGTPFYNKLLQDNPYCKEYNEKYKDWFTKIVREEINVD